MKHIITIINIDKINIKLYRGNNMIKNLVEDVKNGYLINKKEAFELLKYDVKKIGPYSN